MDRRGILKIIANWGVFSSIAPKLKFSSNGFGEAQASQGKGPVDNSPIFAAGAAHWGVWLDWFICPWFADKDRTKFDATDWILRLKEAGVDYVVIETRYVSGLWLFPSQDPMWTSGIAYKRDTNPDGIWPRAGRIEGVSHDYVSELARAAGQQGLRVMISIWNDDSAMGIVHPDWIMTNAKGDMEKTACCEATSPSFASPYADYILNELKGMLDRSPNIEAVAYDDTLESPMGGFISYDEFTQKVFEKRFGKPMAMGTEAEKWQVDEDIYGTFLAKSRATLEAAKPGRQLVSTATGAYFALPPGQCRNVNKRLNARIDDLYEEGHELIRESALCKLLRNTGRPYDMTSPANLFWTEYFFRPWPRIALEGAIALSQGGNFATTVRPSQNGFLSKGETDNLAKAGQWIKKRKPYFVNTESVADAAIWIGPMIYARTDSANPLEPATKIWPGLDQFLKLPEGSGPNGGMVYDHHDMDRPSNGLNEVLSEHHISFDLLPPETQFDKYQLVVLQDGVCMDDTVAEKLRRFVGNGGALLAEGHASLLDERGDKHDNFLLADVFGLNFDGYSPHVDANYLGITDSSVTAELPEHPLIVEGGAILVKTTTARPLGWLVYPAANRLDYRTLGAHNCPGETTTHPGIVRNHYGKGEAIYVAAGLGRHILLRGCVEPWTKQVGANLVQALVARPLYRTDAPPEVEVVFNRQGDRYIVHFLNYYAAMDYRPSTARTITLGRFRFEVSALRIPKIERAFLAPNEGRVRFQRNGNWWTFQLEEPDPIDTILVIEPSRGS